ncbi:glycosyltransferase [Psychroserpens jangbogonensis]|uniref:glycosyltransferase n=1 Tax=Psychroserpens jangbogonensis TaxID=1484460 RepID=UPI00053F2179|nr:glycosyltransferase [Psychroserpens jangbogonensis]
MSTLTIISHTEHYKTPEGNIVGLGSTVTEINHLLDVFDEVVHVAMLHNCSAPPNALPYTSNKIIFIALPALGGPKINDKLAIIWKAPSVLKTIKDAINKTDYFQFRAPTGIGVFVIPYLVLLSSKKGWFKYAGNWKQKKAPLAYSFQRWLLTKQRRKVTINGQWEDQPLQCLTFENPCLTDYEVVKGVEIIKDKTIANNAINFCFVGRLEEEKGIGLLIEAFNDLSEDKKIRLNKIHIVGDGIAMNDYKNRANKSALNFVFHGFLSRDDVHKIYKESNVIILPSVSEGFPKVITEAMNYGCLPMVSNISSIENYVKNEINGFLFYPITKENLVNEIEKALNLSDYQYSSMINAKREDIQKFTYSYYNKKITTNLINNDL